MQFGLNRFDLEEKKLIDRDDLNPPPELDVDTQFFAISPEYRKAAGMAEGEDFKILGVAFADFNEIDPTKQCYKC